MKKISLILIILGSLQVFTQKNHSNPPYVIESIKAYLYSDTKGVFSRDITQNFVLFNTIIGEGDAGSPSHSTMVVVKIDRKFQKGSENRKIRLTATSDGKPKLKQTIDFNLYDNNYVYYAAFWLYDTGYGSVKLTAEILNGNTVEDKKIQSIEFGGGE